MSTASFSPYLSQVDPADAYLIWPNVSHLIRPAMQWSDYGSIAQQVCRGDALLWIVSKDEDILAAVVTKVSIVNDRRICTIIACGGHYMDEWLHLIDGIENYARYMGAKSMIIMGRKGWERALPNYKRRAVILERAL